jgi:hypothetical protein
MTNWILTKNSCPEEGQAVIYFFEYVGVHRGKFEWSTIEEAYQSYKLPCFYSSIGFLTGDVTHWMPDEGQDLPPKPEGY